MTKSSIALILTVAMVSLACVSGAQAESEVSDGLKALFPDGLLDAEGDKVALDALAGKPVIGIYFSASWCPPCRMFTPKLVEYYKANKADFQVVFVSSDQDAKAQFEYMKKAEMPWYTLKHRSGAANALAEKYGVRGIPTLVLVDAEGATITQDGRGKVMEGVPAKTLANK